jgi:hypothetical protein
MFLIWNHFSFRYMFGSALMCHSGSARATFYRDDRAADNQGVIPFTKVSGILHPSWCTSLFSEKLSDLFTDHFQGV